MQVIPSGDALGAEVRGIDLSKPLSDDAVAFLERAWWDNLVLLFRDQRLEDEDLVRLAATLGGAQEAGSRSYYVKAGYREGSSRVAKTPGISIVSNLDENGKPVERNASTGSLEIAWHTDNSYVENPPKGSALYARQVPVNGGGETSFVNQYAAFETLPRDLQERIVGLHVKHDNSRNTAGLARPGVTLPTSRDQVTGPVHPLVRVHPETGRPALYLGRRWQWPSSFVLELSDEESEDLLDRLWAHATQDRFRWTHHWRPNDLILWDNRCVMHKRGPIDPKQPRLMHRTLIKGEMPVAATAEVLRAAV